MSNIDLLLLAATVFSGLLTLGYALFRHDADEEKRKVIKFWQEIFIVCAVLLAVRIFYTLFPAVAPDKFFFGCTLLTGALYAYYKVARREASAEKRKIIKLYRDAFLCLLAVFLFRGFFYDWFRIPSNSMLPTLTVGDLVLTDKSHYGYRLPILNTRLTPGQPPARGDIIVFKKPREELFYIKRIIGIPGDTVRYGDDKFISINGEPLIYQLEETSDSGRRLLRENVGGGWHDVLLESGSDVLYSAPNQEHCRLNQSLRGYILGCEVPPGYYFVLGDNRDHSNDSRRWGFVPAENIVGPATRVIFNHRVLSDLDSSQLERNWKPLALEAE